MSIPTFSPTDYQIWLRMSHRKHLLVEGTDDKQLFAFLLDKLYKRTQNPLIHEIDIDSAEQLIGFEEPLGNNEKVEHICSSVVGTQVAQKVAGFVDRGFRCFERSPQLRDDLMRHNVQGRLVWSRGHSIENYFLDFDTLYEPLATWSASASYAEGLKLFKSVLESAIRVACAVSLAADECGIVTPVANSMTWEFLHIQNNHVTLDSNDWRQSLVTKHHILEAKADELIRRFSTWSGVVSSAEFVTVRWMCHGHVAFSFLWALYARCLREVCPDSQRTGAGCDAARILPGNRRLRFNACALSWAKRAVDGWCDCPHEVLSLLNVQTPPQSHAAPEAAASPGTNWD